MRAPLSLTLASLALATTLAVPAHAQDEPPRAKDEPAHAKDSPAHARDDLTHALEHVERSLWHGWATHDTAPFDKNIVENAVLLGPWGIVSGKAAVLETVATHNCALEDATFADWKAHMLSEDMVILTYTAMQKGECDGGALPAKVVVSAVYMKHGDHWMSASYHETPIAVPES